MTDNTQPEAREFTMSQYASKDDMIGAMRKRIAELEAELEAVGAGGVQALSAAPAGFVPVAAFDRLHAHAESLAARLLAAEQAAPKAAPGDSIDEAMRERDDAEDFIDALLDEVLGHQHPEWSRSPRHADALNDVQERMTAQLADAIRDGLDAEGVLVVVEAEQLCMTMRDGMARGTKTVTSECLGAFRTDAALCQQAWMVLGGKQDDSTAEIHIS